MARILIIDDDEQILAMLRQTLEREGYEVMEASENIQYSIFTFQPVMADLFLDKLPLE